MWPVRTTSLFPSPQNLKLARLFTFSFSFAAINQESLSVVQVTLIKMRGQSVESLHQVKQGARQEGLCVGVEPRSSVMETAVNQVNLMGLDSDNFKWCNQNQLLASYCYQEQDENSVWVQRSIERFGAVCVEILQASYRLP